MRRWFVMMVAGMALMAGILASPAPRAFAMAPIGKLGDVLHVDYMSIVADVAVTSVDLVEVPPGFGYPPRGPRYQVYRANVTVHVIKAPNPFITSIVFDFNGVTPIADAYKPRPTDAPDDLRAMLQNAPVGSTVSGGVYWDVYRDLVTNVVLLDKVTGTHLAQWNLY
ncbi:hypothetical protein [Mycolicibacterium hodleri]|uniref:Exported alanine and valine rich protein n=1 Tax=Mycolicibacterium hodleri TaxID=49897 RepID=A0A502EJZ5_9MYCO|nr:hypothetical protein [Mycolicibacterium hodleri]TPG37434.1 hypothetical protein EAH80_04235 [Mycolicibacterium hodleri]